MAQASSAQREPSMEEILASIRRIIEDSDTVKKPAGPDRPAPSHAVDDPFETVVPAPANSDVVSYLRPAPAEHQHAPAELREDSDGVPSAAGAIDEAFSAGTFELEPAPSELAADAFGGEIDQFDLPADFAAEFEQLQATLEDEGEQTGIFEPAAPLETPEIPGVGRAPILSEVAGRQVAAAFGELSDAFAASRRRSFDEMAEEMIRPMLQEWLDDNLPTLVERLVREEIERVARSGAR